MANPRMKPFYAPHTFLARRPEEVKPQFSQAMGLALQAFDGFARSRNSHATANLQATTEKR